MPPPWCSALPPVIVRLLMVAFALTEKTRDALLPLTVTTPAPGPWRSTESVMSSSPEVSVMVPVTPEANWMMLAPRLALESTIACRREPAPLSSVLITVNVESTRRSSSCSSRSGEVRRTERTRACYGECCGRGTSCVYPVVKIRLAIRIKR